MDENAKHLLASLQRDPSRVQALFRSGDGQTLLRQRGIRGHPCNERPRAPPRAARRSCSAWYLR